MTIPAKPTDIIENDNQKIVLTMGGWVLQRTINGNVSNELLVAFRGQALLKEVAERLKKESEATKKTKVEEKPVPVKETKKTKVEEKPVKATKKTKMGGLKIKK